MSDTFVYPEVPAVAHNFPIVRVVEKNTRNLPLKKFNLQEVEDPEDDVLSDAYQNMVTEAAELVLAKQIEELVAKEISDVDSTTLDPEVDQLLEAVIDEDGEYMREPKLVPHPVGEALMVFATVRLTRSTEVSLNFLR